MKQKITLIRHGKTIANEKHTYAGKQDSPLCPQAVEELTPKIKNYPAYDLLFVSDLSRTHQTAKIIYNDENYIIVYKIRECDMGDFEDKTYSDLEHNPDYQRFLDPNDGYVPNGESVSEFRKRAVEGFYEVSQIMASKGAVSASVVCHGGVIMAIMAEFCSDLGTFYDFQVSNGNGFTLLFDTENKTAKLIGKGF